jgi:predicted kinase
MTLRDVTLTVMCGPPGAGKSYWIAANRTTEELLSTEMVRRMSAIGRRSSPNQLAGIKLLAPDLLRRGQSVIVDACSTKIQDRRDWLNIARFASAHTRIVIVDTDLATCLARQAERGSAGVPEPIIRQHADRMPHAMTLIPSEGWEDIVTVTGRVEGSRTGSNYYAPNI